MKNALYTGAALIVLAGGASAATVDLTTQQLNGNAAVAGTAVNLTTNSNSQRGSVFTNTATAISAATTFSASFNFTISSPGGSGADGLAFVVQNSAAGNTALGGNGAGMGYQGIGQSVIVEFDTWQNGIDNGSENHVGINTNGVLGSLTQADPGFDLDAVTATAWVDYDGTTLSVATSTSGVRPATDLLSQVIDLSGIVGSQAFFGFTAATGGANAQHTINSFDLEVAAVPLPAGLPLLGFGMLMLGGLGLRRKA